MPSIADRLLHVTLKVKRAKEHVADLQRQIQAFMDTQPYRFAIKINPERRPVYYIERADEVPKCLALIAGDIIQNLMSALDHLAFQLIGSDTGDKPPKPKKIYFPIADSAAEYPSIRDRKIQGAAQDTVNAIDTLTPYKGGNDTLWTLHALNNIEKHRILLTVGSCIGGVNLAQSMARNIPKGDPVFAEMAKALQGMRMFFRLADTGFPLKPGFEIYIGAPDEPPDPNQQITFDIAINEPGVCEGKSLMETLHQFTTLVEGIVTALTPRLK